MIVVYTAALGDTDTVREPTVIDPDVRYVCFSDRPCVAPYEWVRVDAGVDPRLTARRYKILADHPMLRAAAMTLWHDASYRLTRNLHWIERALAHADVAAMRHPRRNRIEAEAVLIARYGYLPLTTALAHVARYRAAGFLDDVLTASGLLARRLSAAVERFNATWWTEAQLWGGRDQSSLDYAAWTAGIAVQPIPGRIRNNRYADWRVPAPVLELA